MIKASFEIPTAHILALKEHQDYDFTLAHLALSSEMYRRSYGEGNVMDNGQYELDEPLKIDDLRRAVKLIRPRVMISPDFPSDVPLTIEAHKACTQMLDCEVAGVIVGETVEEMEECYRRYKLLGTEIICLPFRRPRVQLLQVLKVKGDLDKERWHHFLGLKDMNELKEIKEFDFPYSSIDTAKPIKAALFDKTIYDDLRGLGKLDHEIIMTAEQLEKARFNMDRFREECA